MTICASHRKKTCDIIPRFFVILLRLALFLEIYGISEVGSEGFPSFKNMVLFTWMGSKNPIYVPKILKMRSWLWFSGFSNWLFLIRLTSWGRKRRLVFPKVADWLPRISPWRMAFSWLGEAWGMHLFQRISNILSSYLQIPLSILCWYGSFRKRLVMVEENRLFHAFVRRFGLLVVMFSFIEFSNHVCFVGTTFDVPCDRK